MIPPHLYEKICQFCSYQDRCEFDVVQKMKRLKIAPEDFPQAIRELKEEGYLDEKRFTRVFAEGKFRIKGWGPEKIRYSLRSKGIKDDLIHEVLSSLESGLILTKAISIGEKKWKLLKGSPRDKKSKLIRYLGGKGYRSEVCFKVLEEIEKSAES